MAGFARLVTIILMAAIAVGIAPAAAQDDGVGFEDMTGIQQALTRTVGSPSEISGNSRPLRPVRR